MLKPLVLYLRKVFTFMFYKLTEFGELSSGFRSRDSGLINRRFGIPCQRTRVLFLRVNV